MSWRACNIAVQRTGAHDARLRPPTAAVYDAFGASSSGWRRCESLCMHLAFHEEQGARREQHDNRSRTSRRGTHPSAVSTPGHPAGHLAGQSPEDWTGLATTHPERCASLTLVGPPAVDPQAVGRLASRPLVVNGDQGPRAERVRRDVERVAGAQLVTLHDYAILGWTDVVADRTEEIGSAMLQFLAHTPPSAPGEMVPPTASDGEVAGIAYRIQGAGPPLVPLPLGLFPSQWDPLVSRLSEQYCTITLGGAALGMVAMLNRAGAPQAIGPWFGRCWRRCTCGLVSPSSRSGVVVARSPAGWPTRPGVPSHPGRRYQSVSVARSHGPGPERGTRRHDRVSGRPCARPAVSGPECGRDAVGDGDGRS